MDVSLRSAVSARGVTEYAVFGSGRQSLLILPGVSLRSVLLSAAAVADAYRSFADDFTVYLFDRNRDLTPGHTVADMAEDAAAAMEVLGIGSACVFGASQGGMIAQVLAARHPALVSRLVLGSSLCTQNGISRAAFLEWIALADRGDVRALNPRVNELVYSPAYYGTYREIFRALEEEGTIDEVHRFGILVRACLGFEFREEIARISCPVLALGALEDRVTGAEGPREIAARLGCETYLYEGYGHAVYDEAPDYRERLAAFYLRS